MKKNSFRKLIALLCTAALIVSVCMAAPFTVSAATVGVTVNNNGYVSTVDATVGLELPEPEHSSELDFLGWYSDIACTTPFGAVSQNESRTAYAKYNKTVITFENKSDYVFDVTYRDDAASYSNAFTSGVVTDPDNDDNKVFELHSPYIYANFCLPQYEAQGAGNYKLDSNDTYTITAKFKIPDSVTVSSFQIRLNKGDASKTTGSFTAGRTAIEVSTETYTVVKTATGAPNEVVAGQWYTYSFTGNFGDTSKQTAPQIAAYFAGSYTGAFGAANYIYFDDVTIYNVTDNTVAENDTYSGFESAVISYSGGMNSTTSATISTEDARNGSKSLKIAPGGNAYYKSYVYNGDKTAIKLNSYKRYEVTFYYKATSLKSNASIILARHNKDNVWGAGAVDIESLKITSVSDGWQKHTVIFYSDNAAEYPYLGIGVTEANSGDIFYFDDFTVTEIGDYNFLCDFTADFTEYPRANADGTVVDGNGTVTNSSTNGTHPNYYSSHTKWTITDGILSYPTSNTTAPSTSSTVWVQHFVAKDVASDANFKFVQGETYHITVRYKQTVSTSSAEGRFSIASKAAPLNGSKALQSIWINTATGNTDWQTYTFSFTCDSGHANKYLTLTFGSSTGTTTFDVDYVSVQTGVKINNNGQLSFMHDVAEGDTLPEPEHDSSLEFIGWYQNPACTIEFGSVKDNEFRTAYARYNKTVINFEDKGYTSNRIFQGYESGIVEDPTNSANKVYKMACSNAWGNVVLGCYDAIEAGEFVLQQGAEYEVTFKYMLPNEVINDNDTVTLRLLNGPASVSGNNILYSTVRNFKTSELTAGTWNTYTATFTASDLSKGSFLKISMGYDTTTAAKDADDFVYIDCVTIYNKSSYTTVTFNDNGTVYTEELLVGSTPDAPYSNDEQTFIGWYADPMFTTLFGTVENGETRTAYAKYDTTKIAFNNIGFTDASDGVAHIDDPANTENKVIEVTADTTVKSFTAPNYDAANAGGFNVTAGKTYVVRFKVKAAEGSDDSVIGVLGNNYKFDASVPAWSAAAVTFTATENGVLTFDITSNSASVIYIDNLIIYEVTETPSTNVTVGNSTVTATAPIAQNNRLTGTVTVALADGEQIKINGIKITYDIFATAFSETVTRNIFTSVGGYDHDGDTEPGDGLKYVYSVPANAKNLKITAEFTNDTEENLGIIASSVREKTEEHSTGIRFRGRVYKTNGIKNVGFIITPNAFIPEGQTLTLENAAMYHAVTAVATDVIYDLSDTYVDYQVLLKGENMEKLKDVDMHCVIYVEYSDGTIYYGVPKIASYNTVFSTLNQVHYGITAYYGAEYKDTRDKLISTQSENGFSFIMLTDTHIDYSFTLNKNDGANYWYLGENGEKYVERYLIEREIAAVIEMANTTDVDCVILGGDIIHGTSSYSSSVSDLEFYAKAFKKCHVPVYVNRGNHDTNDYHNLQNNKTAVTNVITQEKWTDTLVDEAAKRTAVHDKNDPNSTYYYVDFENKKTRLIVLDPYNFPVTADANGYSVWRSETWTTSHGMEDAQLQWLAKVAIDAEKQGWTYVISAHAPVTGPETFGNNSQVKNIISAYNNKTSVTVNGWTVDYSGTDGSIPFSVSGHTHVSSYRYFKDGDHIAINTGSGKITYYPSKTYVNTDTEIFYHPVRYEGTHTEALFDVFTYETDGTISRYNFGPNEDNIFEKADYVTE